MLPVPLGFLGICVLAIPIDVVARTGHKLDDSAVKIG